jgi:hypothetical protein
MVKQVARVRMISEGKEADFLSKIIPFPFIRIICLSSGMTAQP